MLQARVVSGHFALAKLAVKTVWRLAQKELHSFKGTTKSCVQKRRGP